MTQRLVVDVGKCTECRACELKCSFVHFEVFNSNKSGVRLVPDWPGLPRVRVCVQCKDPACLTKGRIYIQNENIYLRYSSDIPDATVTAFLVYPNNVTKQITLPAVIKAESIGTHDVVFTATKEGYKTAVQKEQFGVIMQEAKIDYTPLTEEGIAEISETTEFDMNPVTIIAILLVIIVIILIWVFISRSSQPY